MQSCEIGAFSNEGRQVGMHGPALGLSTAQYRLVQSNRNQTAKHRFSKYDPRLPTEFPKIVNSLLVLIRNRMGGGRCHSRTPWNVPNSFPFAMLIDRSFLVAPTSFIATSPVISAVAPPKINPAGQATTQKQRERSLGQRWG